MEPDVEPVSAVWWLEWEKEKGFWTTAHWSVAASSPLFAWMCRRPPHQSVPRDSTSLDSCLRALTCGLKQQNQKDTVAMPVLRL